MIQRFKDIFLESEEGLTGFTNTLQMAVVPLEIMLGILQKLEPWQMNWLIKLHMYNKILPITNALNFIGNLIMFKRLGLIAEQNKLTAEEIALEKIKQTNLMISTENYFANMAAGKMKTAMMWAEYFGLIALNEAGTAMILTNKGLMLSMGATIALFTLAVSATDTLAYALMGLAAVVGVLAIMNWMDYDSEKGGFGLIAAIGIAGMFTAMLAARAALKSFLNTPVYDPSGKMGSASQASFDTAQSYDSGGVFLGGGRMYDSGGPTTEHGMAVLQKGETVIPKTRNMLDGGITLNIGGDIVTDNAEDFAERIAQVLPEALRRQNDIGGI